MESESKGKVVMVTGASGGIGSAIARAFAQEGARVVLHYRSDLGGVRALARDIGEKDSLIVRGDLSKEKEARAVFASASRRFGRVDTLIANAGSWEARDVPLQDLSLTQWNRTLA